MQTLPLILFPLAVGVIESARPVKIKSQGGKYMKANIWKQTYMGANIWKQTYIGANRQSKDAIKRLVIFFY